jgi:hypothetical protein
MYLLFSLSFYSFCALNWNFRVSFILMREQFRIKAQPREETGVSFVAIDILEPQTARHGFRSAAISRHLKNSVGRSSV